MMMVGTRSCLFALAIAAALVAPAASVSAAPQESTRIAQAAEPAAKPTAAARVKIWTRAKWEAAKAHWKQDRARWKQCQQELRGKKLSLHRARHFLEDCMTKP